MHPAIMSFLQSRREHFYRVETTVSGKSIVTPRGWEDLSKMLYLYEQNGLETDEDLIIQYLQNAKTAKEFTVYLDLFNKYKEEYPVDAILDGGYSDEITERVSGAGFDEVYTLIGLLISSVAGDIRKCMEERHVLELVRSCIRRYREEAREGLPPSENIGRIIESLEKGRVSGLRSHSLTRSESDRVLRAVSSLHELAPDIAASEHYEETYELIREKYGKQIEAHNERAEAAKKKLDNLFKFAEKCWGEDKELLLITTEITADPDCAGFISIFGSDEYHKHSKNLLLGEKDAGIDQQIAELDL